MRVFRLNLLLQHGVVLGEGLHHQPETQLSRDDTGLATSYASLSIPKHSRVFKEGCESAPGPVEAAFGVVRLRRVVRGNAQEGAQRRVRRLLEQRVCVSTRELHLSITTLNILPTQHDQAI